MISYRAAVVVALGVTAAAIALAFARRVLARRVLARREVAAAAAGSGLPGRLPGRLRLGVALLLGIAVAVLGTTAWPAVLAAEPGDVGVLHGWPLLLHATAGGAAVVVLAVFALVFARRPKGGGRGATSGRLAFWLVLASGALAGGSVLLMSLPAFGTGALHQLVDIHRWSGLAMVLAAGLGAALAVGRGD